MKYDNYYQQYHTQQTLCKKGNVYGLPTNTEKKSYAIRYDACTSIGFTDILINRLQIIFSLLDKQTFSLEELKR